MLPTGRAADLEKQVCATSLPGSSITKPGEEFDFCSATQGWGNKLACDEERPGDAMARPKRTSFRD
jgi:hypothetical protein